MYVCSGYFSCRRSVRLVQRFAASVESPLVIRRRDRGMEGGEGVVTTLFFFFFSFTSLKAALARVK